MSSISRRGRNLCISLRLLLLAVGAGTFGRAAPAHAQVVVPILEFSSVWRYHPNTNDPGYASPEAWTAPGFDDQTWPSGLGLFGFESSPAVLAVFGPINTMILPPSVGPLSSYFRTHFSWSGPTEGVVLHLTNAADDGLIVYLNGHEIFSFNMPPTRPMTWDVVNLPGGSNPLGESVPIVADVTATNLLAGDNLLAVELHQASVFSGDDLFGMKLTATLPLAPTNLLPEEPRDQVLLANRAFTLNTRVIASPPPVYQWFHDGELIPGATNSSLTVTNNDPCSPDPGTSGQYFCLVSNPLGSLQTRTATITLVEDNEPPRVTRVVGSASFSNVVVEFSKRVTRDTAADVFSYELYDADGRSVELVEATLAPNGTSVFLSTLLPLLEGAAYQLSVLEGISDLCGNRVPLTVVPFQSWTRSACSGVLFETFFAPPESPEPDPSLLPGAEPWRANFPDRPQDRLRLSGGFDSRLGYPGDEHAAYGGRMRGLFVPPVSGGWRFFLRSDDCSELWLNPAGPGSEGRILAAKESGCCAPFREPPAAQTSEPYLLIAGQAYYLEAKWSETTGADYCQVAARLEGDTNAAAALLPIPGLWLGSAVMLGSIGSLAIIQQPRSQHAYTGTEAEFTVAVNTGVPVCYQWLREGAEIPGALGPTHRLTAGLSDNGSRFSVRVTMPGGPTLLSETALLEVTEGDVDGPRLIGVDGDVDGRTVTLHWDTGMLAASIPDVSHYGIDGVSPVSAALVGDREVVLTAAEPLAPCVRHSVFVRDMRNVSSALQFPNPTILSFHLPLRLMGNTPEQRWCYHEEGVDLGTAWRGPGYDDSAWKFGPGPLGFEPDPFRFPTNWPLRTVLARFAAFTDKPTVYFRTHFQLPTHPSTVQRLWLQDMADDGCAVYLNGQLVLRQRLPALFDFSTFALESASEPHPVEGPFDLPPAALRDGENVLAAEVHQSFPGSSDVVWGAELFATIRQCGVGLTVTPLSPSSARLEWPDASYQLEIAPGPNGPWTPDAAFLSGDTVRLDAGARFFRLRK